MDKKEILKVLQKKTYKKLILELIVYTSVFFLIMNYNWENLEDISSNQYFYFKEIGGKDQSDWFIEFEILDVYKGDKYNDVVITEINCNGVDCY